MNIKKIGILITHGTDTMSWAFSFLRYSLKNLPCNVVLTGAQIPLEVAYSSSDGFDNVKSSIILLSVLKPPHVCVVFGNGKMVFGSKLEKIKKWHPEAFVGEEIAKIEWDEFQYLDKRLHKLKKPCKLDRLYVIRTGGTIDMRKDPNRDVYIPGGDKVVSYIEQSQELAKYFKELSTETLEPLRDSSNLVPEDWLQLCKKVAEICNAEGYNSAFADTNFDLNVKPIYLNPFCTKGDYLSFLRKKSSGFIIVGYGAGNVNIIPKSGYSIIPFINKCMKEKKPLVLASQVPLEIGDFQYETGLVPIELGCIPSLDRPVPDAQVKLSYILGHKDLLFDVAKRYKMDYMNLIRCCFLAGAKFRTVQSREYYETKFNIKILPRNPFIGRKFEDALEEVINYQKSKRTRFRA